jgi:prephenate dehydratase
MRYAYLGPEGTFTESAVASLLGSQRGYGEQPVPHPSIGAALAAVRAGDAERAVVPMESSVEGIVTATVDDLTSEGDLLIHAETRLPIEFSLLARPGTTLPDIKAVGGHPQAEPQCRRWLAANLPGREWVPLASNAEAARRVAEGSLDAALAGSFAAAKYGLAVLAPDVHDRSNAVTRFVVVGPAGQLPAPTGSDRTSLAAFLADDHPGALMEILTEFAVRGVNLSTIQSRPTGGGLGSYFFFIDCEGHIDDARVGEAMMGVRRVCAKVRFLGSYPRSDGGQTQVRPGTSDPEFAEAAAWLARLRYGRPLPAHVTGTRHQACERLRREQPGRSEVGTRAAVLLLLLGRLHEPRRKRAAHLLELRAGRHLLCEQRGLDAVEESFEPADQLRLGDSQFGLARRGVVRERQ